MTDIPKNREYQLAATQETQRWPDCSVSFGTGGKHLVAKVTFQGRSRTVFFPHTPSDSRRGVLNFLQDLRKELRELGAERSQRPKSQSTDTERSPRAKRPVKPPERRSQTPAEPDKWLERLRQIRNQMSLSSQTTEGTDE